MISTKDVSKFDYLRHRPFLVIERYKRPIKGQRQRSTGPDLTITDRPTLVYRISDRIIRTATVIIDIQQDRVVKNQLKADATMFDDEVLRHFKDKCATLIQSAHQQSPSRIKSTLSIS